MTDPDDFTRLISLLEPGYPAVDYAMKSILDSMEIKIPPLEHPRCQTVIIEKEYVDRDFASTYSRFYSHLFMDIHKRCIRVHFLSQPLGASDLIDLEGKSDAYLGYTVVRPTKALPLGRTVISANVRDPNAEFVLTKTEYSVNLSGSRLKIEGAPFIQQDGRCAACASAALWMATSYLSRKYDLPPKSTVEITELAAGYDFTTSRLMPPRGLTVPQMMSALSAMGYSPQLYDHPYPKEAKQTIYSYVESRIPVILAISLQYGNHAVVAIGNTFRTPTKPELAIIQVEDSEQVITQYENSDWIPEFIIHDDQGGLYGRTHIMKWEDYVLDDDDKTIDTTKLPLPPGIEPTVSEVHCPIKLEYPYLAPSLKQIQTANLFALIVPLPPGVSLLAEDARRKARELLILTNFLYNSPDLSNLVLRTYLTSSNEFKEKLKHKPQMHERLRAFYRGKPMSRHIWITEISTRELFDKERSDERLMLGEIIMDSAASPLTPSFITLHVPGYVMQMNPEDTKFVPCLQTALQLPGDQPYPHEVRT